MQVNISYPPLHHLLYLLSLRHLPSLLSIFSQQSHIIQHLYNVLLFSILQLFRGSSVGADISTLPRTRTVSADGSWRNTLETTPSVVLTIMTPRSSTAGYRDTTICTGTYQDGNPIRIVCTPTLRISGIHCDESKTNSPIFKNGMASHIPTPSHCKMRHFLVMLHPS